MDKRLKQRLIGAAVLVALAVIFVPMLLQGPVPQDFSQVPIEIPPKPVVAVAPGVPAPTPESPAEPVATPVYQAQEPAPRQPEPAPVVAAPQPPQPAARAPVVAPEEPATAPRPGTLEAWVVQVGSFGVDTNARGLRDKLRKQGYSAFVDQVRSNGRTFFRVRVGPMAQRDEAEAVLKRIDKSEGLKGKVMSHP